MRRALIEFDVAAAALPVVTLSVAAGAVGAPPLRLPIDHDPTKAAARRRRVALGRG